MESIKFYTIKELAQILRMSYNRLLNLHMHGVIEISPNFRLKTVKIGRRVLVSAAELNRALKAVGADVETNPAEPAEVAQPRRPGRPRLAAQTGPLTGLRP